MSPVNVTVTETGYGCRIDVTQAGSAETIPTRLETYGFVTPAEFTDLVMVALRDATRIDGTR